METLQIGKTHYRRLKYGPAVTLAFGSVFGGEIPVKEIELLEPTAVAKFAFCFLDEIGKRQFNYSWALFKDQVFKDLKPQDLAPIVLQLNIAISKESAQPLENNAEEIPQDEVKKKHTIYGWVTVAFAIWGIISLLNTVYRAVLP